VGSLGRRGSTACAAPGMERSTSGVLRKLDPGWRVLCISGRVRGQDTDLCHGGEARALSDAASAGPGDQRAPELPLACSKPRWEEALCRGFAAARRIGAFRSADEAVCVV